MAADLERLAREVKGIKFKGVRDNLMAQAGILRQLKGPEHIVLTDKLELEARQETTVTSERITLRESFTDTEKEALIADGALIYIPKGETIPTQGEAQTRKGKPSFWFVVEAGHLVLAVPSRQVEMAIYPVPDKFFVPNSFDRSVEKQEEAVEKDAADLRKRLCQESIGEIIPDEASTLTDITFQHLDATGKWLFGPDYVKAQELDWVYGRTKNPTNKAGSNVACVGRAGPDHGVDV